MVVERTDAWFTFYQTTPTRQQQRLHQPTTWPGEDYGHSGIAGLVTIIGSIE